MESLAQGILSVLAENKQVYLRLVPEVVDFTKNEAFQLQMHTESGIAEITVDQENLIPILGILKETVFSKDIMCVFWNAKNLFSTILRYTKKLCHVACKIIDLKIIEAYLGIREDAPKSFEEAISRKEVLFRSRGWETVYKKIHLPLILDVVPELENVGIIDSVQRKLLRAYYEIGERKTVDLNVLKSFRTVLFLTLLDPSNERYFCLTGKIVCL